MRRFQLIGCSIVLASFGRVDTALLPQRHDLAVSVSSTSPFALTVSNGRLQVDNTAILAGNSNNTATSVSATKNGALHNGHGHISINVINSQVAKVSIGTDYKFVGARFRGADTCNFYGVWEYPWNDQLTNNGVKFDLKGTGDSQGVNWANARAPFFFSSDGYGVYADTVDMGSYDFTKPGYAEFIFNTSNLDYYIILPKTPGDMKSILTAYAELSNTIYMPPDSSYGPTFWSDDWEQDFHDGVHNSQQNYYDVVNHLYEYQIHATAMFADRPYGTGNYSFGNFDFDPRYYPTPEKFIANLSDWGYDFQVWVANRAFLNTDLFKAAKANDWLFPGIDPEFFLGPALNLSIPEAYEYFKSHLSYFPSVGVKGYKIDRGEEGELPVWEQNIQATLFDQLCYETMVEKWGEGNFYNFARNAVDQSRSKTAIWNGDSHSNWTGLSWSIASGIRSGLIGFSQWGSDTGGYIRDLDDPHQELWCRWMWFSAFSPVYEIPIGTNHTPWYPTEANPYTAELVNVLKETAALHYDLFPYIKSFTYQAHKTGLPVIRAAFLEFPNDEKTYIMHGAYFFGSEMFVAPIANPDGQRSVYFPKGTKYLEYFNKTSVYAGGTTAAVEMDLHYVPAYVRAGAIVPRGRVYQGNDKWTENWSPELTIELYPSSDVPEASFLYYSTDDTEVEIVMWTDPTTLKVLVEYGQLGCDGSFVLYHKGGTATQSFEATAGSVMFHDVQGLF